MFIKVVHFLKLKFGCNGCEMAFDVILD